MTTRKLLIGTAIGCGVLGLAALFFSLWYSSIQINQAEADKKCAALFDEVKADLATVPGYSVVDGRKTCTPIEDELSMQDYKLIVRFRVNAEANLDSEAAIKDSMKTLAAKLPARSYPVGIHNMQPADGQKPALCVGASRYIDNDGKEVPQGPPTHSYGYVAPDSDDKTSACDSI
jgi:hypothetical protein